MEKPRSRGQYKVYLRIPENEYQDLLYSVGGRRNGAGKQLIIVFVTLQFALFSQSAFQKIIHVEEIHWV